MLAKILPKDVLAELTDQRYLHLKHNSRGTYASGCRGPLCRKAERDRQRIVVERSFERFDKKTDAELELIIQWLQEGYKKPA